MHAILKRAIRLHAHVVVSLLTGIRTEEARALRWSHVAAWIADGEQWRPVSEAGFDHERFGDLRLALGARRQRRHSFVSIMSDNGGLQYMQLYG